VVYEFKIVFFIRMNILVHIYIPHIKMTQKWSVKDPQPEKSKEKKFGFFLSFF